MKVLVLVALVSCLASLGGSSPVGGSGGVTLADSFDLDALLDLQVTNDGASPTFTEPVILVNIFWEIMLHHHQFCFA